jgi:putative transposase
MKRSRFSVVRFIGIVKEHTAGMSVPDLCRRRGISDATFYNWRRMYGGVEVADAKRLKALEAENAKFKKMLTVQMIDVATLKEMLGKTSEARLTEESGGLGRERETIFATARLCVRLDRSLGVSAPLEASG